MGIKKKTPALPVVRKLRFPLDAARLKNWMGNQALSDFFHGLSVLFPEGEKEFIDSVRPFVSKITDPELRAQVDAFIKQEAHHTREHVHYNEVLEQLGYPALALEKVMKRKIRWAQKNMSLRTRLAFTVCSEHFTAVLADAILSEDFPRENLDPICLALWRWHAIEEIEHKAVAFDVYDRLESTYPHRVLTMALVTLIFGYDVAVHANAMMRSDGIDTQEGWREVRKIFFSDTKLGWRVLKNYLRFYKPGFHPWEHANGYHLERWNSDYERLLASLGAAS